MRRLVASGVRSLIRLRLMENGPGINGSGSASLSGRSLGTKRGSSIMMAVYLRGSMLNDSILILLKGIK